MSRVAIDAKLVQSNPSWFSWENGRPAIAVEAGPGGQPHALGDSTDLPFDNSNLLVEQADHSAKIASHFLDLGLAGFRCPRASAAPSDLWRNLIGRVRTSHPDATFIAASLGVPFEAVAALEGCGFDYVLDSSRWWDLRERWFPMQREELRRVASPAAFPEEPQGQRLAESFDVGDTKSLRRLYLARYKIAACIGTALIMPMGYEYASRRRFDPIHGTKDEWDADVAAAEIELGPDIAIINAAKSASAALNYNGPLIVATPPNGNIVGLIRLDKSAAGLATAGAALVINPDLSRVFPAEAGPLLTASGGKLGAFVEIGDGGALDANRTLDVQPLEARLFLATEPPARAMPALEPPITHGRVAIERVEPEVDGGRFPAKRIVGEKVDVEADIVCDGHDIIAAQVLFRAIDEAGWQTAPMAFVNNDRWRGSFIVSRNTRYVFTLEGWKDPFASWRYEVTKKFDAGVPIALELIEGRHIVERAVKEMDGKENAADGQALAELLTKLNQIEDADQAGQLALLLSPAVQALMERVGPRNQISRYERELEITVDRTAAAFAAWYELFPRSMSDDPARHGTFDDVIKKLPYVKSMGFDVLYFPPIHPIGRSNRKGRNNTLKATKNDPGSPYAIGSPEGGHDAIHPELGTMAGFKRLIDAAADAGLEIAIDFAIQCSPDHPWIKTHHGWFEWRPDGSIRYAENPPKKYQDIVNVDFYAKDAVPGLWEALRDVVLFWCEAGIKIFRVDNPHTKPLPFWEWLIAQVQKRYPETIYLAEAFTRPKMMKRLAKLGFTQSYSYFTWRNTKFELSNYLTELIQEDTKEYMRVNFFVNTPDINPVPLQTAGRAGFRIRALMASTLSPVWGLYCGFELCEATPIPGREEYLDSEKYEIRAWDWDRPGNIREDIAFFNRLRRENQALWGFRNLEFLPSSNDQVLVYVKSTATLDNIIVIAANLDTYNPQQTYFELPLWRYGLADDAAVIVEDLVSGQRFDWHGKNQHVWLDHNNNPYAIWRVVLPGLPS
ncbi:alpha-1,4-glucan--maltose-1-phosphate maltosyltransferase [Arboricoccus pini]|uniref:alpha-1,4-glucan--maltose-1-phosphate maltosyltransferase n=1 Tax=Arboricoccus pini TaxID=1963835 RepID=UPI001FAFC687|nr:alpha-1,4-glucan--maltose-1-phosphate maltosyltransferase [Arboricoccus pini]